MKPLIIHHLSDIHIGPVHYNADRKRPFDSIEDVEKPTFGINADEYIEYIKSCSETDIPDFIMVTGDLTSYAATDELKAAQIWLTTLAELIKDNHAWRNEGEPSIFVVPGNHDINWQYNNYDQKVSEYARYIGEIRDCGVASVNTNEDQCINHIRLDKAKLIIYLFNSTKLSGTIRKDLEDVYKNLAEIGNRLTSKDGSELESSLDKLEECIKQDPGYVLEKDMRSLQSITNKTKNKDHNHYLKVALMHHNPVSVPSNDIETHETIVNSGLLKKYLDTAEIDIVLYGHRHKSHASNERYIGSPNQQGIYYIGAPSLGCDENGAFIKIKLEDIKNIHNYEPPSVLLGAQELTKSAGETYSPSNALNILEPVNRPMHEQLRSVHKNLGRSTDKLSDYEQDEITQLLRTLLFEHDKCQGWNTKENWTETFLSELNKYSSVYATDVDDRLTKGSPRFQLYLIQQYIARMESLKTNSNNVILFSDKIYDAILNTGWKPEFHPFNEYEIAISNDNTQLQVVRILIINKYDEIDKQWLYKMNYDHMQCAIPLFVIDDKHTNDLDIKDLAMGLNANGEIKRCFIYDSDTNKVIEDQPADAARLKINFETLLKSPYLRTVNDFISTSMLFDPDKMRHYSSNYDRARKSSKAINTFIQKQLPMLRELAIDMGSGTGNYSFPLADIGFRNVIGVDSCRYMLHQAKIKDASSNITWIKSDFRDIKIDKKADLIISVSALHYVKCITQQEVFFTNAFNILNSGGKLIIEMEFKDTLESLWLDYYFKGLSEHYTNSCFSIEEYKNILLKIGYKNIQIHGIEDNESSDQMLRYGFNKPDLYPESSALDNMPIFLKNFTHEDIVKGKNKIDSDIRDGSIKDIISKYKDSIHIPGISRDDNVYFLTAEK